MDLIKQIKSNKQSQKSDKILEIAWKLFLKNGFEKTSLQMIVKETGGSLSTIYKMFNDKRTLFSEALKQNRRKFIETFEKDFSQIAAENLNLEEYFYRIGVRLLTQITSQESIAFRRLMFVEGYNNEELLETFYNDYVFYIKQTLENGLEHYNKTQKLGIKDLNEAVGVFAHSIMQPYFIDSIMTPHFKAPAQEVLQKDAKKGVKLFILYLQHYKDLQ